LGFELAFNANLPELVQTCVGVENHGLIQMFAAGDFVAFTANLAFTDG